MSWCEDCVARSVSGTLTGRGSGQGSVRRSLLWILPPQRQGAGGAGQEELSAAGRVTGWPRSVENAQQWRELPAPWTGACHPMPSEDEFMTLSDRCQTQRHEQAPPPRPSSPRSAVTLGLFFGKWGLLQASRADTQHRAHVKAAGFLIITPLHLLGVCVLQGTQTSACRTLLSPPPCGPCLSGVVARATLTAPVLFPGVRAFCAPTLLSPLGPWVLGWQSESGAVFCVCAEHNKK